MSADSRYANVSNPGSGGSPGADHRPTSAGLRQSFGKNIAVDDQAKANNDVNVNDSHSKFNNCDGHTQGGIGGCGVANGLGVTAPATTSGPGTPTGISYGFAHPWFQNKELGNKGCKTPAQYLESLCRRECGGGNGDNHQLHLNGNQQDNKNPRENINANTSRNKPLDSQPQMPMLLQQHNPQHSQFSQDQHKPHPQPACEPKIMSLSREGLQKLDSPNSSNNKSRLSNSRLSFLANNGARNSLLTNKIFEAAPPPAGAAPHGSSNSKPNPVPQHNQIQNPPQQVQANDPYFQQHQLNEHTSGDKVKPEPRHRSPSFFQADHPDFVTAVHFHQALETPFGGCENSDGNAASPTSMPASPRTVMCNAPLDWNQNIVDSNGNPSGPGTAKNVINNSTAKITSSLLQWAARGDADQQNKIGTNNDTGCPDTAARGVHKTVSIITEAENQLPAGNGDKSKQNSGPQTNHGKPQGKKRARPAALASPSSAGTKSGVGVGTSRLLMRSSSGAGNNATAAATKKIQKRLSENNVREIKTMPVAMSQRNSVTSQNNYNHAARIGGPAQRNSFSNNVTGGFGTGVKRHSRPSLLMKQHLLLSGSSPHSRPSLTGTAGKPGIGANNISQKEIAGGSNMNANVVNGNADSSAGGSGECTNGTHSTSKVCSNRAWESIQTRSVFKAGPDAGGSLVGSSNLNLVGSSNTTNLVPDEEVIGEIQRIKRIKLEDESIEEADFRFEIEDADRDELMFFLENSFHWFQSQSVPPPRDEFKMFLQGGYIGEGGYFDSCSVFPEEDLEAWEAKTRLLELIARQTESLRDLIHLDVGEEPDPLLQQQCGWPNARLDNFLDAATQLSNFRHGEYHETWQYLYEFYESGREGADGDGGIDDNFGNADTGFGNANDGFGNYAEEGGESGVESFAGVSGSHSGSGNSNLLSDTNSQSGSDLHDVDSNCRSLGGSQSGSRSGSFVEGSFAEHCREMHDQQMQGHSVSYSNGGIDGNNNYSNDGIDGNNNSNSDFGESDNGEPGSGESDELGSAESDYRGDGVPIDVFY